MSDRYELMRQARAKRVYQLRADGISVKQTAELVGCRKAQVRALHLLGERLASGEHLQDEKS
jgi:biotin operon repressor